MGENHFESLPTAGYGVVLFLSGSGFINLVRCLIKSHGEHSEFAKLMSDDRRGPISLVMYALGAIAAFWQPVVSCILYVAVAIMWLVPYRSVEKLHHK